MDIDKTLKEDITNQYLPEYIQAEKSRRTGFQKGLTDLNDQRDLAGIVVAAMFCFVINIPLGVFATSLALANAALMIHTNGVARRNAAKAIEKDINNGVLPARYSSILDDRLKALNQQVELYTSQKAKLPKPGDVSSAFSAASDTNQAVIPVDNGSGAKPPAVKL